MPSPSNSTVAILSNVTVAILSNGPVAICKMQQLVNVSKMLISIFFKGCWGTRSMSMTFQRILIKSVVNRNLVHQQPFKNLVEAMEMHLQLGLFC